VRFDIGTIAAACALGYLDLRKQVAWRSEFPALVPWLDAFRAKHPEFDATSAA
jgi:glutathione S-transferase